MKIHDSKYFMPRLFSSKTNSLIVVSLFFLLSLLATNAGANSFTQSAWASGEINDEAACTLENGVWQTSECIALDGENNAGWNAFAQKDEGINLVNTNEALELDYATTNMASILSTPYNTNDISAAIEIIRWNEILPASTDIQFQIRTAADVAGSPGAWSSWLGPDGTSNSYWNSTNTYEGKCFGSSAITCNYLPSKLTTANNNQWFQVLITFSSSISDTGTLLDFTIVYSTGRLGQWRFDGTANDETFRARSAELSADTIFIEDGDRNAISMDGLNGHAKVSGYVELGLETPYTYEGWFKLKEGVTDGSLIHLSETSNGRGLCYSPVSIADKKLVASSFDGSSMNLVASPIEISPGIWNHFVNTWDPINGLKLYLNGILQGVSPQTTLGTVPASMYFHFGFDDPEYTCAGDTGTYFYGLPYGVPVFSGELDNISVYNIVLDEEIIASRVALESVPIPAIFDSIAPLTVEFGDTYEYEIKVSDADFGNLTITGTTLPGWMTLTDYGNGYAILTGTPGLSDVGLNDVTLNVFDGEASVVQTFQIDVTNLVPDTHWKYDNNALDSGKDSKNGSLYGGPVYDESGISGQALVFDGVNDRVYHGTNYYARYNQEYTHTGWVNIATGTTVGNILYISYSSYCFVPMSIVDGKLVATSRSSSGSVILSGTEVLAADTWYHYATTWSSTDGLTLYINGVLIDSTSQTNLSMSSFNHSLYTAYASSSTSCNGNTQTHFKGKLDDIRYYQAALSADQISDIYNTTLNQKAIGMLSIDGEVKENASLYANTTILTDGNGLGALSYQWSRSGIPIDGATASSYTLTESDVGNVIRLSVSFIDGAGYVESINSTLTALVQNINDPPVGGVDVVGDFIQGGIITVENDLSDMDGLGFLNYQWRKNGIDISNEIGQSYVLKPGDVGSRLSVSVSYTDGHGTVETVVSDETVVISNMNDLPQGEVTISGVLQEDSILTAFNTVTDIDGINVINYQWLRNGVDIDNATTSSYTLGDLDVSQKLSVRMSYVDNFGTAENVVSEETGVVANINDLPTGNITIVGTFVVGETVSLNEQLIDPDGLGEFNYSWRRSSSGSTGVTTSTYLISESDEGSSLSVKVSYIDGFGKLETFTATSAIAIKAVLNEAPVISPISDMTINMNATSTGIAFSVSDDNTSLSKLNITVYSQDTELIPDSNINIVATEAGYELSLTPRLNAYGSLMISVRASDGLLTQESSFSVTIAGTDTDNDGKPDVVDLDDDNDGLPDSYEIANGMNPLDASDAALDSDGDGKTNLDDYLASDERDVESELEGTIPTIVAPLDIEINSSGLYTSIDLGEASAQDSLGNEIAAFADERGPFKPGMYFITWTATDVAGNTVSAQQRVTVIPLVNFAAAQIVDEGSVVEVIASLNGNAAIYPVTIPYTVGGSATNPEDHNLQEGSIVIQSGLKGSVMIDVVKDELQEMGEESIVITMGETNNAVQGSITSHTVTIVEYNVAPDVILAAVQNELTTDLIVISDEPVVINAIVTDPNRADTHRYNWSFTDNNLIDIDDVEETLTIDATTLVEGVYTVKLIVNDSGTPVESSMAELALNVVSKRPELSKVVDSDGDGKPDYVEGFGDEDGDRIPNYLDAIEYVRVLPLMQRTNTAYLLESSGGQGLRLGKIAFAAGDHQANVTLAQFDKYSNSQLAIDVVANIGGYVDVELYGLAKNEDSVMLVLPQLSEIPENATMRVFTATGWEDFKVDGKNRLRSAQGSKGYCPPPGDEIYAEGLMSGYWCVQLSIEDNGQNDAGREIDGVLQFSGGIGKQAGDRAEPTVVETVNKATLSYFLLLYVFLIAWRRKS